MDVRKVVVVGVGAAGSGIAQVAACSGFLVAMQDLNRNILERALLKVKRGMERGVASGQVPPRAADEALARIQVTTSLAEACAEADFVVESVPEHLELKQRVLAAVDAVVPPHTVLASNTAGLSITAMGATTGRPDRVVGMHWFAPAPGARLVEVVRGARTSDAAVTVTRGVAERAGKTVITCRDATGFVVTRAFVLQVVEAVRMLEEGVASARDVDAGIKLALGLPAGPLELADHLGLDDIRRAGLMLADAYGDRFRPPQTLVKLVEAGHLGVKTGQGFHRYDAWTQTGGALPEPETE